MPLSTTTHAEQSEGSPRAAVISGFCTPLTTGIVALVAWTVFVVVRLAVWGQGQISYFIGAGVVFEKASQLPPGIHQVLRAGYDGQFYYRLALNPFNWAGTAYGITMDQPYRYTRIGYPFVTWLLSLGQQSWVPVMLVVVNLLAVFAMAVMGGIFARDAGRNALWGLLIVAYFGMVVSVGRDTAEPLADACMLGGMLAYRRSRYVISAVLLAYGVISNDPILAVPAAIALTRLYGVFRRRTRFGVQDLTWVLPAAAWLALEVIERLVVPGRSGGAADVSRNITYPFGAMIPGLRDDVRGLSWTHLGLYDINLIEFIALAAFVVAALVLLRRTTAPPWELLAFGLFVLIEMVMASAAIWTSVFSDGRLQVEAFVLAVIVLLATPKRNLPTRYLGTLAAVVVAVLLVVARRRILYQ